MLLEKMCFQLLLHGHGISSVLDSHPMLGVGSAGCRDSLHSGGVLCLDNAQRVWKTKGRVDLVVLVSRLAKTFSLFERCPMNFFLPALFPCTGFGFEAAAAEWGLRLEILTLKPPVFLGLGYDLLAFLKCSAVSEPVLVLRSTCGFEMFLPEKGQTGSPQVLHCLGRKV